MVLEQSITGRPRERAKARVRAERPPVCWLCGYPIDLTADPHRDPLAHAVDEIIPRSRGGSAVDDANLMPAHRWCNGSRGTKPMDPADPAWRKRTTEPEEVRTRCRKHIEQLLTARTPVIRTW